MSDLAALDDVLVIDASPMMPGHFCTLILADLGARVISIERPGTGHYSRSALVGSYESVNRNKESVTLDLKQPGAQAVLHRLVERADVFVEGFRPGVASRLGAGYETLRAVRPDLVYCSISGYGQDGPYRDMSGHDPNYLAVAGVLYLAGDPDGPPEGAVGASMADLSGAWFATMGILAALRARDRHGIGQYVDVALADTSYALVQSRMIEYLMGGHPPKRELMARPGIGMFEAADGRHLTLGAAEDHFWVALCRATGLESWIGDERFATPRTRRKHGAEIRAGLRAVFVSRSRDDWLDALREAGVPCAPVNTLGEAAEDPHAKARDLLFWMDDPGDGRIPQIRFPARLSETPARPRTPPPRLGEHTDSVLADLGYSPDDITALHESGAA